MLCIRLPIRCDMHQAAALERYFDKLEKSRLNDAPLMVSFLGPWIGEENSQFGNAVRRQFITQEFNRVAPDDSYIGEFVFFDGQHQVPHARSMNFDTYEVLVRLCRRHLPGCLTVAEPNFNNQGSAATKNIL